MNRDTEHRAHVTEILRQNPEIVKRAKARRRAKLRRLGIAYGGGKA